MKKTIIASLAIVALVGCNKNNEPTINVSSDVTAVFADAEIVTRTTNDLWEDNDQIGIFMYQTGQTNNTYSLARENVLYTSNSSGEFSIGTGFTPIYYPQSSSVDFYAYYPYQAGISSSYSADITKQNDVDTAGNVIYDQGEVDFMIASLSNKSKSSDVLSFQFDHKLAMLTLVIKPNTSISTLDSMAVKLTNINTQATFSTLTGEMNAVSVPMADSVQLMTTNTVVDNSGNVTTLTATAIVLPETLSAEAQLVFQLSDTERYTAKFPTTPSFEVGKNHVYYISVGYQSVDFTGNSIMNGWDENPNISDDTINATENL